MIVPNEVYKVELVQKRNFSKIISITGYNQIYYFLLQMAPRLVKITNVSFKEHNWRVLSDLVVSEEILHL